MLSGVKWNLSKEFKVEGVGYYSSMTVTAAGEVVMKVRPGDEGLESRYEARWYDQQGKLLKTLSPQCEHGYHGVLATEISGKQHVAFTCRFCQCFWLGSLEAWNISREATSKELELNFICQGKPGQIIATTELYLEKSVTVFDITQIPFRMIEPEIKLGMAASYLCYCDIPGVGDALAVTDVSGRWGRLAMFSLDSGALLWSAGGEDGGLSGYLPLKVAGANWTPYGVCTDNRGRLYVADLNNIRIIVFSVASGSVLQVVQGRGHWEDVGDPGDSQDWVVDPGITVYGSDIKYTDDNPEKGVASGSVLQQIKDHSVGYPRDLYWNEKGKSIYVCGIHKDIHVLQLAF